MDAVTLAAANAATSKRIAGFFNIKQYGAKGDRRIVNDGALTAASATLTSATASFTAADVGKTISIPGAGTSGATHFTTVSAVTNATTATLAAPAATTITGAQVAITTNDSAAIQAAIDACSASGGGTVWIPQGEWLCNVVLKRSVTLRGVGRASVLRAVPYSTTPVIGTPTDTTRVYDIAVKDLQVNGNKPNGATGDGINLSQTMSQATLQNDTGIADPAYVVDSVVIKYAGQDGIALSTLGQGGGEHFISNCYIFGSGRYGLNLTANDCKIINVSIGASKQHGVYLVGGSNQLTGVKSWYAGYDAVAGNEWTAAQLKPNTSTWNTGAFDGFYINNGGNVWGTVLTGCEAQDNGRYGLNLNASKSVKASGLLSNGDVQAAVYMTGNTQACDLDFFIGTGDRGSTANGVVIDGASPQFNRLRFGYIGGSVTGKLLTCINGGTFSLNEITMQTENALFTPGSPAASYQPDTANSGVVVFPLKQNTTVAAAASGKNAPGARLTVIFIQDATGGRTVTWDASYRGASAVTIATAANAATIVTLVNVSNSDAPNWMVLPGPSGI